MEPDPGEVCLVFHPFWGCLKVLGPGSLSHGGRCCDKIWSEKQSI